MDLMAHTCQLLLTRFLDSDVLQYPDALKALFVTLILKLTSLAHFYPYAACC